MIFIFKNKTIFWDISKWNRKPTKWNKGNTVNYYKGNVNECCIALVKNLIKESFYGKRKKSN